MPDAPLNNCWRALIPALAEHFCGHGVPSVKAAIEGAADKAAEAVKSHPDYDAITGGGIEILWVNPFVTPEIFFCLQDATDQKFDNYFSPIILTTNTAEKDTISNIHTTFHNYYKKNKKERHEEMITLSDLSIGEIGHLTIIDGSSTQIYSAAVNNAGFSAESFEKYINLSTNDGAWRYGIYRIGLNNTMGAGIEMGRVYIGFKVPNNQISEISQEVKLAIKRLSFDILSAFVLAGVLQRNRVMLGMLEDFGRLMRAFDSHVFKHRDVLVNIGMDKAEGRRREVKKLFDELNNSAWESESRYRGFCNTKICDCTSVKTENLAHVLDNCKELFSFFKNNIMSLLNVFLNTEYPSAKIPQCWPDVTYRCYSSRSANVPESLNILADLLPNCLNTMFPPELAEQGLPALLQSVLLLLMDKTLVRSNLGKLLVNSSNLTDPVVKARYDKEKEIVIASVSWMLSNESSFIPGLNYETETIEINGGRESRIKQESLTNVLAFATLFFNSVFFTVRTKAGDKEKKAEYSFCGEGIRHTCPSSSADTDNIAEYRLVLKP